MLLSGCLDNAERGGFLYESTQCRALWRLAAQLERTGVDRWRLANAPNMSLVDALALSALAVSTQVHRKPGGNISVTVIVEGRRATDSEAYYFSLQRGRFGGYKVINEA